jgi:hypothetical protein
MVLPNRAAKGFTFAKGRAQPGMRSAGMLHRGPSIGRHDRRYALYNAFFEFHIELRPHEIEQFFSRVIERTIM